MGFDARLKRFFPAVICAIVALAAYFQARGLGQLMGSSLVDPTSLPAAPPPPAPRGGIASNEQKPTGAAILGRNPFDSKTGPLDGQPPTDTPAPVEQRADGDPYADPLCDSAKVLLITAADDPAWSFAAIAGAGEKSTLRRIGDDVGGKTVHAIAWDRVWLSQGGTRCQIPLHSASNSKVEGPKGPTGPSTDKPEKPTPGGLPKDIASKIVKVSDTQFDVERSVIETVLERQGEFFKQVRITPVMEGGKSVGFKVGRVAPNSLLGSLGMQTGDQLENINGFEMGDPTKALEAFTRLRSADKLAIRVKRGGKPVTIDINFK